jgi:hypothetical protein
MNREASRVLYSAFHGLHASSTRLFTTPNATRQLANWSPCLLTQSTRLFSTSSPRFGTWLEPDLDRMKKTMKGRPRVATGGSTKGTTVIWGEYGLRMIDFHRRISAKQLKTAEDTIKTRLRGEKYRLYKRVCCNIGVFISGNEVRHASGSQLLDSLLSESTPRFEWEKERDLSTTGQLGWLLIRSYSRLREFCTTRLFETLCASQETSSPVSESPQKPQLMRYIG